MTLEDAIYTRLSGFAGLTALVGANIYQDEMPQSGTMPAVVFQVISDVRQSNFGADTGDVDARVQVTCFGEKSAGKSTLIAVKEQVRAALQRYVGNGVTVTTTMGGPPGYEPEAKIYTKRIDFKLWFKE